MPSYFYQSNTLGIPSRLLWAQVLCVIFATLAYLFSPTVKQAYWFLSTLATEIYMMMYLLLFLSLIKIRKMENSFHNGFRIPGGKWGLSLVCILGIMSCIITMIEGFYLPAKILPTYSLISFRIELIVGIILAIILPYIYLRKRI